jgi:hypothetical protein
MPSSQRMFSTDLPDPRSGPRLRSSRLPADARNGHPGQTYCTSFLCRATDWVYSPRMSRSRDHWRRSTPPSRTGTYARYYNYSTIKLLPSAAFSFLKPRVRSKGRHQDGQEEQRSPITRSAYPIRCLLNGIRFGVTRSGHAATHNHPTRRKRQNRVTLIARIQAITV